MASGDYCVQIGPPSPPGDDYATWDARLGGSTPGEHIEVFDFPADATKYLDFDCWLKDCYAGGGLTLTGVMTASAATSGTVRWEAAIRRLGDDLEDMDTSHTYVFQGVSVETSSTCGNCVYFTITFTSGAQMDNWAAGEKGILRIRRVHDHVDDDMTGDAELHFPDLTMKEA